jgi:hypothetical protein
MELNHASGVSHPDLADARIKMKEPERPRSQRDVLAEDSKLSPDDVGAITEKLHAMDSASEHGPWTRRTLQLIAEQPGVVSTVLARQIGIERYAYKALIRRLKELGLTYSLDVGYAISPRGRAYLRLSEETR